MIRSPERSDQSYVCSTWMRSARIEPQLVNAILDHATTKLLVAHAPGDPGRITGWIAWSVLGKAKVLHYVYVRGAGVARHRGNGIGRELVLAAGLIAPTRAVMNLSPIVYTLKGPDAASLLERFRGVHLPIEQFLEEKT